MLLAILIWLGASGAVAYAAVQRGRGGPAWFFVSCAISPLLAILVLMACPAIEHDPDAPPPSLSILQ